MRLEVPSAHSPIDTMNSFVPQVCFAGLLMLVFNTFLVEKGAFLLLVGTSPLNLTFFLLILKLKPRF